MRPLVSILVPIYKVPEKYLRQCIESLVNQSMKNIEIILVDDGSPDSCGSICDEYAENDPRIKVIHKVNGGLASARNIAFKNSTGEYITFVDGDDYLSEETCEYAHKTAKENNVEMVMWCTIREFNKKSEKTMVMEKDYFRKYSNAECKRMQGKVLDFKSNIATVTSKLILRNFVEKYNIVHEENLSQGAEGFIFNIKLYEYLDSACFIKKFFYHYTYNKDSITHSHNIKNYYLIIDCFEFIRNQISNNDEMLDLLYKRVLYAVVTTAISGYFNPVNKDTYSKKKKEFKDYLEVDLVQTSLRRASLKNIDMQRKLILNMIKRDIYFPLDVLGKIRRLQPVFK